MSYSLSTCEKKICESVIDPALIPDHFQKTVTRFGFDLNAEFTKKELNELISKVTLELIPKIEIFLQDHREIALNPQKTIQGTFEPYIAEHVKAICKISGSTRHIVNKTIFDILLSYLMVGFRS